MQPVHPPLGEVYDLAVIGGGINGVGIAADAAGRGLRVLLCEQDDLAAHTSSASSKLIHGGLRYLEHYQFRLVREALGEREVLLGKAPHLVRPLRFILPHRAHLRPAWLIRAGLFLYDHLGPRQHLAASRYLRLAADSPLQADIRQAFEYADCWVDDARLVVANAQAARERGAHVHCRTRCIGARRSKGLWHLQLERRDGSRLSLRARTLVNAAGPWAAQLLQLFKQPDGRALRLVQGSHIVLPRLYPGEHAYILQNEDGRIVFVLPFQEHFSLVGTTDREYQGDPAQVRISDVEIDYLLAVLNRHFRQPVSRAQIVHSFSGVRPLYDDHSASPSAVSRDYTLALAGNPGEAPLLSVFGGKLTTYRRLAEATLQLLAPSLPHMGPAWTANAALPGGEQWPGHATLVEQLRRRFVWLPASLAQRWTDSYGVRVWRLLQGIHDSQALGRHFGAGLYQREVDYLCDEEWAQQAEDILWRRSKLGLLLSASEQAALRDYLAQRQASRTRLSTVLD